MITKAKREPVRPEPVALRLHLDPMDSLFIDYPLNPDAVVGRNRTQPFSSAGRPRHHPAELHFFSGLGPNLPEVVLDLKGPQALKCRTIASPGCRLAPATRTGTQCTAARPSSRGWWQPGDRSWTWASRLALARVGTWDDRTGHAPMIDPHAGREKVCQQRGRWATEPSRHPRPKTEGPPDRSPAPDG